jgi:hypothetical protein
MQGLRMKELIIIGLVTFFVFGTAFYQSYRDKLRWRRISSGMSLFGDREDIPPLVLDDKSYEANGRRVMIIWHDAKRTSYETVADAKMRIEKEIRSRTPNAKDARIFAWDGESWKQRM